MRNSLLDILKGYLRIVGTKIKVSYVETAVVCHSHIVGFDFINLFIQYHLSLFPFVRLKSNKNMFNRMMTMFCVLKVM